MEETVKIIKMFSILSGIILLAGLIVFYHCDQGEFLSYTVVTGEPTPTRDSCSPNDPRFYLERYDDNHHILVVDSPCSTNKKIKVEGVDIHPLFFLFGFNGVLQEGVGGNYRMNFAPFKFDMIEGIVIDVVPDLVLTPDNQLEGNLRFLAEVSEIPLVFQFDYKDSQPVYPGKIIVGDYLQGGVTFNELVVDLGGTTVIDLELYLEKLIGIDSDFTIKLNGEIVNVGAIISGGSLDGFNMEMQLGGTITLNIGNLLNMFGDSLFGTAEGEEPDEMMAMLMGLLENADLSGIDISVEIPHWTSVSATTEDLQNFDIDLENLLLNLEVGIDNWARLIYQPLNFLPLELGDTAYVEADIAALKIPGGLKASIYDKVTGEGINASVTFGSDGLDITDISSEIEIIITKRDESYPVQLGIALRGGLDFELTEDDPPYDMIWLPLDFCPFKDSCVTKNCDITYVSMPGDPDIARFVECGSLPNTSDYLEKVLKVFDTAGASDLLLYTFNIVDATDPGGGNVNLQLTDRFDNPADFSAFTPPDTRYEIGSPTYYPGAPPLEFKGAYIGGAIGTYNPGDDSWTWLPDNTGSTFHSPAGGYIIFNSTEMTLDINVGIGLYLEVIDIPAIAIPLAFGLVDTLDLSGLLDGVGLDLY